MCISLTLGRFQSGPWRLPCATFSMMQSQSMMLFILILFYCHSILLFDPQPAISVYTPFHVVRQKLIPPRLLALATQKSEHTMHQTHGRRLADLTPLHFDTDILYLSYILPLPYLFVLRRSTELDVFVFISIHMAYLSTSVYMDGETTAGSQIDQRATWFSEFFFFYLIISFMFILVFVRNWERVDEDMTMVLGWPGSERMARWAMSGCVLFLGTGLSGC